MTRGKSQNFDRDAYEADDRNRSPESLLWNKLDRMKGEKTGPVKVLNILLQILSDEALREEFNSDPKYLYDIQATRAKQSRAYQARKGLQGLPERPEEGDNGIIPAPLLKNWYRDCVMNLSQDQAFLFLKEERSRGKGQVLIELIEDAEFKQQVGQHFRVKSVMSPRWKDPREKKRKEEARKKRQAEERRKRQAEAAAKQQAEALKCEREPRVVVQPKKVAPAPKVKVGPSKATRIKRATAAQAHQISGGSKVRTMATSTRPGFKKVIDNLAGNKKPLKEVALQMIKELSTDLKQSADPMIDLLSFRFAPLTLDQYIGTVVKRAIMGTAAEKTNLAHLKKEIQKTS
jgi:hypothetical protein